MLALFSMAVLLAEPAKPQHAIEPTRNQRMTQTSTKLSVWLSIDGRLINMGDWTEEVANILARNDDLALTPAHWEVLREMREYYFQYNITPIKKLLKKALVEAYGTSKATDDYLEQLFPYGVLSQGSKIAGLPEPHLDAEIEHQHTPPRPFTSTTTAAAEAAAHFQHQFEFNGKVYEVYEKGNLVNLDDWNEDLAEFIAQKEGITLTDAHWGVLRYLRKFYFEYGITPMVKILMKHARAELGPEKSSREYLYGLFPKGPSQQGSRIAGLPEPQGCIDG